MSKVKKVGEKLTLEETSVTDTIIDGGLGILKAFQKDDIYYSGTTVATAQGVGLVAGMFVASRFPQLNPF